jgi:hypothetical protein
MFRCAKSVGVVTNNIKVGKGLSCAPKEQPHAHSGGKKHGQPAYRGKLRLIIVLAEFDLAIWRNGELTESMINQARLVNRTPVIVEENWASPAVSMIPQVAIRPVKVSAMSSSGFLNTGSPFCYIQRFFTKPKHL